MCVLVLVFVFSSRRRHTRCALVTGVQTCALPIFAREVLDAQTRTAADAHVLERAVIDEGERLGVLGRDEQDQAAIGARFPAVLLDRKSVVSGKSVSVRVDLGGRRLIKKKKTSTRTSGRNFKQQ